MIGVVNTKYGAPVYQASSPDTGASAITAAAVTSGNAPGRLSLENPVIWLVGIGAATLGLIAVSTHARVGPLKASVSV